MEIRYTNDFVKTLRKAPQKVKIAVRNRVELYLDDKYHPLLNNHVLRGQYAGCRSINITGDWRAVFIEIGNDIVSFRMLGTHSELYKM